MSGDLYKNGDWSVRAKPREDGSVAIGIFHKGYQLNVHSEWGWKWLCWRGRTKARKRWYRRSVESALRRAVDYCDRRVRQERDAAIGLQEAKDAISSIDGFARAFHDLEAELDGGAR